MCHNGVVVDTSECQFSSPGSFPERENMIFFSMMIWLTFCEKSYMGRDRTPDFVIFVVWIVLVVGRWVMVAWGKKSYLGPAEISSVAYLV